MPVRFSVPFSLEGDAHRKVAFAAAAVHAEPFASRLGGPFGVRRHEHFERSGGLETIFSLKLSRMYGFPELPLPESSLLQWLQHSIIVTMAREAVRKERIRFIFICVLEVSHCDPANPLPPGGRAVGRYSAPCERAPQARRGGVERTVEPASHSGKKPQRQPLHDGVVGIAGRRSRR